MGVGGPGGKVDETKVCLTTIAALVQVTDAEGRAGLAKANHPDPNEGVTAPGADLLDPKETISELVDAGFPLDAVGLMNSMFIESNNASRTPKEGIPLRGEIDDNVPGGGDSRGKGRDGLGTGPDKVPGAGADGGDSSG